MGNRDMIKYYSFSPKEVRGEIFLFNHYPFIYLTYLLVLNNLIFYSTLYIHILIVQSLCLRSNATLIPTLPIGIYLQIYFDPSLSDITTQSL